MHIGGPKTGTTSIQNSLMLNRAKLFKLGIFVPETLGESRNQIAKHRWLSSICKELSKSDNFLIREKLTTLESKARKFQKLESLFIEECNAAIEKGCKLFILSDEHLVGLRENELDKLRSILYSIFDNIDIIYYIRDPLDSAISMMSTQLKAGSCIDSLKEPKYFKLGDQWNIIQKFRIAFETATFIVRRFEKQALERADVVTDFYKQLNVDAKKYCFTSSRRKNVSLSLTGMKFLLKLNIEFPMIIDGVYDRGTCSA